jgi:tyrosine-protein phosphatase SIW14
MPSYLRTLFGLSILALLVGGPLWYLSYHNRCFRNFHVVEEGVLYRSGQLNLAGLKRIIHDYGIKTVVSLRDGDKTNDSDEEKYIDGETALNFVRIMPRAWWASDGSVPAEIGLAQFREVMANPANYPVLVHCFAGIHRTGAFCAVRRMDNDGWSNADAIREMRAFGYTIEHMDVLPYLRNYRPHPLAQTNAPSPFRPVNQQKSPAP